MPRTTITAYATKAKASRFRIWNPSPLRFGMAALHRSAHIGLAGQCSCRICICAPACIACYCQKEHAHAT